MSDQARRKRSELQDVQAVLTRIVARETKGNTLPVLQADENKAAKLRSPAHTLLVGPQGSGKTTLIHAFREECVKNPQRRQAVLILDCQRENFASDTPRKAVVRTVAALIESVVAELEPRRGVIFGRKASELVARGKALREKLLPLLKRSDVRDEMIVEDSDDLSFEEESTSEGSGKENVKKSNTNVTKVLMGVEGKITGAIKGGIEYSRRQADRGHSSEWNHYHKAKTTEKRHAYRRVVQYRETNDILHDLESQEDDVRAFLREARLELSAEMVHLCLDNFSRVPMSAQPWVADYLRRMDQSISIKLVGEISQVDPFTVGEKGSFGLQEGVNLNRVDVTPQLYPHGEPHPPVA